MDTKGKTGIEIAPGLSGAQKVIGKLLHAIHLEALGIAVANTATMVITLDGESREEPFYEAHFVECTPGTHALALEWRMYGTGTNSLARSEVEIVVMPGMITELVYTMTSLLESGRRAAKLELKGTRVT